MRNSDSGTAVPPGVTRIAEYLSAATLPRRLKVGRGEWRLISPDDERRRAPAVRALHTIWIRWLEATTQILDRRLGYDIELLAFQILRERWIRAGAPTNFDRTLRYFFDRAGGAIFRHPDPTTAMRDFWEGPRRRRGRPLEDLADRNLRLFYEVAIEIDDGGKYEAAVTAVAEREGLSKKTVENAYGKHKAD